MIRTRFLVALVLVMVLAIILSGCTTIQRHPVLTAIVVGSIAATAAAHGHGSHTDRLPETSGDCTADPTWTTQPVNCTGGGCK